MTYSADGIDFSCSPCAAMFYAARGLTAPVPAEMLETEDRRQLSDKEFIRYIEAKERGTVHTVAEWLARQRIEMAPRDTGENSPIWNESAILWPAPELKTAQQTQLARAADKRAGQLKALSKAKRRQERQALSPKRPIIIRGGW